MRCDALAGVPYKVSHATYMCQSVCIRIQTCVRVDVQWYRTDHIHQILHVDADVWSTGLMVLLDDSSRCNAVAINFFVGEALCNTKKCGLRFASLST